MVYHATYLNFLERARTEWLRALGYEQDVLREQYGLVFAVRSMDIQYLKPARFNDALLSATKLLETRPASLVFEQTIFREEVPLCSAVVRIACVSAEALRPKTIPKFLLQGLMHG